MKKKVGLIGLGKQGTSAYLASLAESKEAELFAICDIDRAKLAKCEAEYGIAGYSDFKHLIREDIDFIIVATPHHLHYEIIKHAAEAGIHVLKEKPFARNISEAWALRDLCEHNNISIMTSIKRRFYPHYKSFLQYTQQIGELEFITATNTLFLENPLLGWRGSKEQSGGGCIIDLGYHLIDLIIWYFGVPSKVLAEYRETSFPEITANILFSYASGLHGVLTLSRRLPPKTEHIKVIGSQGILEAFGDRSILTNINGQVVSAKMSNIADTTLVAEQIDYFCKVIDGKANNFSDIQSQLDHMQFIEACYRSKYTGQYVNPRVIMEML